ncbi:MAG: hypothetical protein ABL909_11030 [Sphingopyxis sp.]
MTKFPLKSCVFGAMALGMAALPGATYAQKPGGDSTTYQPVSSYRVEAHSEFWVNLNLCANPVVVDIRGDGDTDIDFTIYDDRGNQVFQDLDLDDIASATLNPDVRGDQCRIYRLKLNNIGNVWNQVRVSVGNNYTNGDAPSVASYRVEANADYWVDLNLCRRSARIVADGDGDTDVDFTIYDRNNNVVVQDLALNDNADFSITVNASANNCRQYRLKMHNLGNVWNQTSVTIWEYW